MFLLSLPVSETAVSNFGEIKKKGVKYFELSLVNKTALRE
jgi:hypothetical protein